MTTPPRRPTSTPPPEHAGPTRTSRALAIVHIGLFDAYTAGIQCWAEKYDARLWRPVLGVRQADRDGLPATFADPDWAPLGAPTTNQPDRRALTPPFPAYPSGHATFGAAAFRAARIILALPEGFTFDAHSDELDGIAEDTPPRPRRAVTRRLSIAPMDGNEGRYNGRAVGELVAHTFPRRIGV